MGKESSYGGRIGAAVTVPVLLALLISAVPVHADTTADDQEAVFVLVDPTRSLPHDEPSEPATAPTPAATTMAELLARLDIHIDNPLNGTALALTLTVPTSDPSACLGPGCPEPEPDAPEPTAQSSDEAPADHEAESSGREADAPGSDQDERADTAVTDAVGRARTPAMGLIDESVAMVEPERYIPEAVGSIVGLDAATIMPSFEGPPAPAGTAPEPTPTTTATGAAAPSAPMDPLALAAGTVALAALAGTVVSVQHLALANRFRQLLAALPFVGGFSKIAKDDALAHPTRAGIVAALRADPGLSAQALRERFGVGYATVMHHLRVLENHGFVASLREGRHRRYLLRAGVDVRHRGLIAILANDATARVLDVIRAAPGATQSDLARRVGLGNSTVHWHARRLVDAGAVRRVRDGRLVRYWADDARLGSVATAHSRAIGIEA